MVIDVNLHTQLFGEGEHLVRTYSVGRDNDYRVYDADLYELGREFDLFIDDLTIESSSQRLKNSNSKTNNIINSIMPFDTENCVKWNPNYLKGFSSEKRDTNVEDLKEIVSTQIYDIGRFKANETLGFYDRGVKWTVQNFDIKGLKWESAYLPVWLYSYQQIKGNGESILHYVAINARTRETMGSIPIYMSKLVIVSAVIEIVLGLLSLILYSFVEHIIVFTLALGGIIFFLHYYRKYSNADARHYHERETRVYMDNLQPYDQYLTSLKGLGNETMKGANNMEIGYNRSDEELTKLMNKLSLGILK